MQIVCSHCQRQLNLPDDKVPAHRFALDCPVCKGRIEVDPAASASAPAAPPQAPAAPQTPAAPQAPPTQAPQAPAPADPDGSAEGALPGLADASAPANLPAPGSQVEFSALPPTRELDKELFAHMVPSAAIVRVSQMPAEHFEAGLRHIGIEEIQTFDDLPSAVEAMLESDFSILLILLDQATAPPCEPLQPLYELPLNVRRETFVALVASNVRSLDGQTAFYLQVNCLINSGELPKFPAHLQRALFFHLRHYQHWGVRWE